MLFGNPHADGVYYEMHDSLMAHIGMEHDQQHSAGGAGFGSNNDGWVDVGNYSSTSQHQSPVHEYGGFGYMQSHGLPTEPTFVTRMAPPPTQTHQQLLPLIMPSHPTWPSMLTNPAGYQAPPVAIPPASSAPPLKTAKLPAIHAPSPRKTLTDADRRRMCQYHEENPSIKQTEIGAIFGVERSTVSKVLRQKEKYLFPEDRSISPVKRTKGKFPDIDRALANWVRNSQKQGLPLTDAAIKEKARFFATTVGNNESHLKANSTSWLEKFKQKNGIGGAKLMRRASETNISDRGSLNPDSAGGSVSHTPSGISPAGSPGDLTSPSSLSGSRSEENMKAEGLEDFLSFGHDQGYRHSNSQSTTSLSSAFTDTAPSSFSGGPTSPTTPFAFSPEVACQPFMPSQQSRLPPPAINSGTFQRPRSQTFPMLNIDPSYISTSVQQQNGPDNLTPKFHSSQSATAPSSALESHSMSHSPIHDLQTSYSMDSISSSPALHHRSSNSSMAPPSTTTPSSLTSPLSALTSPPSSSLPSSPTQDDARRALDTLLTFLTAAPQGFVDQTEYMTVLKLTEKLRLGGSQPQTLPGGLHRILEGEGVERAS